MTNTVSRSSCRLKVETSVSIRGIIARVIIAHLDLFACPESVNILPEVHKDVRTSDKLIDGVNHTRDVEHMWLSPVFHSVVMRS